jgi:hypothetical protein
MSKPKMSIEKVVEIIAEGCADYADGDDPGRFSIEFDPSKGELVVSYSPDGDMDGTEFEAQFTATKHRFALVSAGLGWPEGGTR